jgi:hypothetical protein
VILSKLAGPVQGLWIGERLSALEQLSIRSFLACGHEYHLYVYGPIAGVPLGARLMPAREILPPERIFKYPEHDSYAGFANHFRYQLLYQRGGIWADCDVICLQPLRAGGPLLIPGEDAPGGSVICNNCLLAAPPGHPLLARLLAECESRDVRTLRWGDTGPTLVTRLVAELGLQSAVRPPQEYCPVPWSEWESFLTAEPLAQARVRAALAGATAVHLWHELWRRAGIDKDARHPPGCAYEELLARYPDSAPRPATSS